MSETENLNERQEIKLQTVNSEGVLKEKGILTHKLID
jgi:hypothetical protein